MLLQQHLRYTLGKQERVKSRKVIEQLFKEGKAFSVFPYRVIWQATTNTSAALQAGFSVSSRHFKKAVHRNRIKRLMREAYRLQKNGLQIHLEKNEKSAALFFIYTGKEIPDYILTSEKINMLLKLVLKKYVNDDTANT